MNDEDEGIYPHSLSPSQSSADHRRQNWTVMGLRGEKVNPTKINLDNSNKIGYKPGS